MTIRRCYLVVHGYKLHSLKKDRSAVISVTTHSLSSLTHDDIVFGRHLPFYVCLVRLARVPTNCLLISYLHI